MKPDHWQLLESAFHEAAALDAVARRTYLARLETRDAALHDEVVALLAAAEHASIGLGHIMEGAAATLPDLMEGQLIGAWRVVRRIGAGGMGAVYLAQREGGDFAQRAALKLVRHGLDSAEITHRFQAERRILARLEHPHIARLLDGGSTDDGHPWFCMEYVDGQPITEYCAAQRLGIEARLELFAVICRAVHYAHRNLIVHRDLKPGNILVAADGTVKLLDFGIAKIVGGDDTADASVTRIGVRVMTPQYASPEQVRGESVTTATDVFSLGVILYELLCGERPYREGITGASLEAEILSATPPRPTAAVRRGTGADRPAGRLTGELDDICLMALRKEPERRYASVEALGDDIERYRNNLPVRATRDHIGYRVRKFVGRHPSGTLAAAGLILMLAVFGTLYVTQVRAERNLAQLEARKAAEVAAFLRGLFAVSDPAESEGRDVTARELLDQGAARIETELAGQPEVQAAMVQVIGEVYAALGRLDDALPLLERSVSSQRALLGADHPDLALSLRSLGKLLVARGEPVRAVPLLDEALAIQQASLGAEHEEIGNTLLPLGFALNSSAQYDSAEAVYRRAIELFRRLGGDGTVAVAQAQARLAHTLVFKDELAASEPLYRAALVVFRDSFSELHTNVRETAFYHGDVLYRLGEFAAAEPIFRETLRLDRLVVGEEHHDVALGMNSLGNLLGRLGRFEQADTLLRDALAMRRRIFGAENRFVAQSLGDWGWLKRNWGDLEAADSLIQAALAMFRRTLGDEHSNAVATMGSLGMVAIDMREYDRARAYLEDAMARQRILNPDGPSAGYTRGMALVLAHQGQHDSAEQLFRQALEINRGQRTTSRLNEAETLIPYGSFLTATGRAQEGEPLLREALAILERSHTDDHYWVAEARTELALCLARLGRAEEAERLGLAGHRVTVARFAPSTWRYQESARRMAELYEALSRPAEAASYRATLLTSPGR